MALTKVTGQVIKNTTDVTVGVLTVTNTLAVGGTVSIGGTLTYEDVTNVDAVGLITARNGIVVGSGITLSKDGDVFFTGIATGNGSGLTALNASNIGSGTVPTARLGSGTASSSTFLRGDSTFQTVSTDLVDDTSPQLGGGLESNGFNINFADSSGTNNMAKFGASGDLQIYHDSVHSRIVDTGTGDLKLQASKVTIGNAGNTETMATFDGNGAVQLYHDNTKMFETRSGVSAFENGDLYLDSDSHKLKLGLGADLNIYHNGSHSYIDNDTGTLYLQTATNLSFMTNNNEDAIQCIANGAVSLYHNNNLRAFTTDTGLKIKTTTTDVAKIEFQTGNHDYSLVGYTGLNRFGIDTHDGLQVRDASASYAVRMTIDASGNTFFNGMTSLTASGTNKGIVMEESSVNGRMNVHAKSGAGDVPGVLFYHSGNHVGGINYTSSATSYNTSSDYRLKENVTAISDGITRLKTLKPYRFNFKIDPSKTVDGFFAHEVTAVPEAVHGEKDEVDTDNNPVYQGIDQSKLVPLLTAALQEAITEIETLKTKVAALEG